MPRELEPSQEQAPAQGPEPQSILPSISPPEVLVEKMDRQSSFQRALVASGRNNFERSRRTAKDKEITGRVLALKYLPKQEALEGKPPEQPNQPNEELLSFHLPEGTWFVLDDHVAGLHPSLSMGRDDPAPEPDHPVAKTLKSVGEELGVDRDILDLLIEDQTKANSPYHFMETNFERNNPLAPKTIIEEDLSEDSKP